MTTSVYDAGRSSVNLPTNGATISTTPSSASIHQYPYRIVRALLLPCVPPPRVSRAAGPTDPRCGAARLFHRPQEVLHGCAFHQDAEPAALPTPTRRQRIRYAH